MPQTNQIQPQQRPRSKAENLLCAAGFERWDQEPRLFTYPVWAKGMKLAAVTPDEDPGYFYLLLVDQHAGVEVLDLCTAANAVCSDHSALTSALVEILTRE